jgi:hypothetical protein
MFGLRRVNRHQGLHAQALIMRLAVKQLAAALRFKELRQ